MINQLLVKQFQPRNPNPNSNSIPCLKVPRCSVF
jgi:hypothetical protein